MLSQKAGFPFQSKLQTDGPFFFFLWLCGVDGIEVMERRRFTRGFAWVIFSLQGLDFSQDEEADAEAVSGRSGSALLPQDSDSSIPKAAVQPPKHQHRATDQGKHPMRLQVG